MNKHSYDLVSAGFRSIQRGYSDDQIKEFKEKRWHDKSTASFIEWMPFRKELNDLGFSDELIIKAIKKHYYNFDHGSKDLKKYFHWITEIKEYPKDQKPKGMYEQVSGVFDSSTRIEELSNCGLMKCEGYVRVPNVIEYRIQRKDGIYSILDTLLVLKNPKLKKYFRKTARGAGLGSWYTVDIQNLDEIKNFEFRTKSGDIPNIKFVDVAKGKIGFFKEIEQEINEYKEWNKEQMRMNDQELEKYLKDRGYIYIYDGKGHEPENLVKKYIPTVKQQRQEWIKAIERIKAKYQDKKWIEFLTVLESNQ